MSVAESRETVRRVTGAIENGLDRVPAPLYVSIVGVGIILSGLVLEFLGYGILAAMAGAYGIATVLWGILAWVVVLAIMRWDSYRR